MSIVNQRPKHPSIDDAILDALLSGNRARAMLYHIRQYGGTTQEAWRAISDLVEVPTCDKPSQDPHVDRVERYLHGRDTADSTKWNLAMLCIAAVGLLFAIRGWSRMSDGIQSYWWPKTSAIVTDIRHYATSYWSQQRKVVRNYVDYKYSYEVDGRQHSATVIKQRYIEMFDGPPLRRGDAIRVLFDESDPSKSIHVRDMYQRALPVVLGVLVMLPALGLLALSAHFELTHRDLERCDPARDIDREPSIRKGKFSAHAISG